MALVGDDIPRSFGPNDPPYIPARRYRYFSEVEHAEQFVRGKIFTNTLTILRKLEDAERGDPEEGTEHYTLGHASTDDMPVETVKKLAVRAGITLGGKIGPEVVVNGRSRKFIPDAWVLCTTMRDDPAAMGAFGQACVEIRDPHAFFERLSGVIANKAELEVASSGPVNYASNAYADLEDEPGRIGYVKAPDKYQHQREYRGLWIPARQAKISKRTWNCPAVRDLIRRLR